MFKISSLVTLTIEKLRKNFLWLGIGEHKRDHLTSWDLVCKSKVDGGLGFAKISIRNRALLGKWGWMFPKESFVLWH